MIPLTNTHPNSAELQRCSLDIPEGGLVREGTLNQTTCGHPDFKAGFPSGWQKQISLYLHDCGEVVSWRDL